MQRLKSHYFTFYRLWIALIGASCLLLSPVISRGQSLADVDCMAASDPDACITQLSQAGGMPLSIKGQPPRAAASTPVAQTTPATSTEAPPSKPAKSATTKSNPTTKKSSTSTTSTSQPPVAAAPTSAAPVSAPAVVKSTTPVTLAGTSAVPAQTPLPVMVMPATPEPTRPDILADSAACQNTPNPDECVRNLTNKQGTPVNFDPRNLPLNSDLLGWSGPLKVALRYDADLSWIVGLDYIQMLSESVGVSVKTGFGANERRANITAGFAIDNNQQIKLTYEYLTQNLNFDFATGGVQQWVDQHAVGGAYQYLLRHEILHSLELSGYTIRANSKDLSDIVFNPITDNSGNTTSYDVNYRRIAGGTENTLQAALNLLPFKNTALTVGGGFSQLSYDTQYESNQANSTVAYQAQLTHLLTDKTKVMLGSNGTASGTTHTAEIRQLLPGSLEVSVKGQTVNGGGLPSSNSVMLGFSYPAPQVYSIVPFGGVQELRNWIEKPVVYATRVLAIKDEKVVTYSPNATDFAPQTIYIDPVVPVDQPGLHMITPLLTKDKFNFADPALTVTYVATCTPACTLTGLNLQLVAIGSNQAELLSSGPVPNGTAGNYTITITGTGTRAGLSAPIVISNHFSLTVKQTPPNFPTAPQAIDFDTTGDGDGTGGATDTGLRLITDGIDLSALTNDPDVTHFTLDGTPPNGNYWQLKQDPNAPQHWFVLRNRDMGGNLFAGDIGTTTSIPICIFEANSVCIKATLHATVTADGVTTKPANIITVAIPQNPAFTINSNMTLPNWNTGPLLRSTFQGPMHNLIPVLSDDYTIPAGAVTMVGTPAWPNPPTPNPAIDANGIITGMSPKLDTTPVTYAASFNITSAAKGSATTAGFTALVNPVPVGWTDTLPFTGALRFDLINSTVDAGLQPQPYDSSSNTLIDLTARVNGANPIFSFESNGGTAISGWSISQCASANCITGDWYLFRGLNTDNHLDAAAIGAGPVPVNVCLKTSATTQDCRIFNVTVTGEDPTNTTRTLVKIGDSVSSPSFSAENNTAVNWNLADLLSSYYMVTSPAGQIVIDHDSYSNWESLTLGTAWIAAPALNSVTGIISGGLTPNNGGVYQGTFAVTSQALNRQSSANPFYYDISTTLVWNIPANLQMRFDFTDEDVGSESGNGTTNGFARQIGEANIDLTTLVTSNGSTVPDIAFAWGSSQPLNWKIKPCRDVAGDTCLYRSSQPATGNQVKAPAGIVLDAGDVNQTDGLRICASSAVLNATVCDSVNVKVMPDTNPNFLTFGFVGIQIVGTTDPTAYYTIRNLSPNATFANLKPDPDFLRTLFLGKTRSISSANFPFWVINDTYTNWANLTQRTFCSKWDTTSVNTPITIAATGDISGKTPSAGNVLYCFYPTATSNAANATLDLLSQVDNPVYSLTIGIS